MENSDFICKKFLEEAKELRSTCNVQVGERKRKKKKMSGETADDVGLTAENEVLLPIKSIVDKTLTEMGNRFHNLRKMDSSFDFRLT